MGVRHSAKGRDDGLMHHLQSVQHPPAHSATFSARDRHELLLQVLVGLIDEK